MWELTISISRLKLYIVVKTLGETRKHSCGNIVAETLLRKHCCGNIVAETLFDVNVSLCFPFFVADLRVLRMPDREINVSRAGNIANM